MTILRDLVWTDHVYAEGGNPVPLLTVQQSRPNVLIAGNPAADIVNLDCKEQVFVPQLSPCPCGIWYVNRFCYVIKFLIVLSKPRYAINLLICYQDFEAEKQSITGLIVLSTVFLQVFFCCYQTFREIVANRFCAISHNSDRTWKSAERENKKLLIRRFCVAAISINWRLRIAEFFASHKNSLRCCYQRFDSTAVKRLLC